MKKSLRMTEGSISKKIIFFAIPLFLGNLFQQLYNTADSLIVGNFLGSNALAAVSSSGNLIFLMVGFINGIAMGAGVVIARYYGAKKRDSLQKAIHTTVAFGLAAGAVLTVLGMFLAPKILVLMGTPADVLPESIVYFRTYFAGSMGVVMYNIFVGVLQSVGDGRHQLLCMALAKCDAIASGNFLNLRWFQPEHFETIDDKQPSRRAVWYYCPQALSEYKIPFLDIAKRMDLLDRIEPPVTMKNKYSEMLFNGSLPSSTGFGEKEAFRHYLYCLHKQCQNSVLETYAETKNLHVLMLETAEQLLSGLGKKGIKGQDRDFTEILDVNRAAISAFDMAYHFPLSQEWNDL